MKKILSICVAFAMFAAIGCEEKKTDTKGKTTGTPASTPTATTPAK